MRLGDGVVLTNWSLSRSCFCVNPDCPRRVATVKHHLYDIVFCLRRVSFPSPEKTRKGRRNLVGFGLPVFGAGSWVASEGENFRQLFLPPRSFLTDFACRPSPPYIARIVCRFHFHRLVKLRGGEFNPQTRHSEEKTETNFVAAGAGERGTFGLRAALRRLAS